MRSSRFPFAQVPTGDLLDLCHKRRIFGRSAGPCPFSERDRSTVVKGEQKSLPILDKSRQGSICDKRAVHGNFHVKPGTQPGILPCNGNQTGPYGVSTPHIALPPRGDLRREMRMRVKSLPTRFWSRTSCKWGSRGSGSCILITNIHNGQRMVL